jgi:hypothetical protein
VNKKAEEGRRRSRLGERGREGGRELVQGPDMETWQCVYAEAAADGDLGSGNLLGS